MRDVRILDRDATVCGCARYLCAMYGFHAPIENTLATDGALEPAGFAAALRRKTPRLAQDLRSLDASWDRPCDRAAVCRAIPVSDSLARRVGIACVIEGSTLGGEYILAHLPPGLAGLRRIATSFLEGHGAETGARWRGFGEISTRLIAADPVPGAEAEVIAGACDTFERLIAWLAQFERRDDRRAAEAS